MPIPFAPLVGFLIGVVMAWAAAAELARDDGALVATRPFVMTAGFTVLVYAPLVGYFPAFHGDWAYLYFVAWRRLPSAVDLALVLLGAGSVPLGFLAAVPFVRRRKLGALAALVVGPAAITLALFALVAHRVATSATYAQFHGNFGTEPITSSALGRGVMLMVLILAAGVAWTLRAILAMNTEANGPPLARPTIRRG